MTNPQNADTLQDDAADNESSVSLIDILLVLLEHKFFLTLVPLAIGSVVLGLSFLIKPVYTASAQMMPPQQQQGGAMSALLGAASGLGGLGGALGSVAGLKNPNDQWIALLKSRPIADGIVQEFKLREVYESDYQFQARLALAGNTRILAGKDNLITIEFDDEVPERAARVVKSYVNRLQDLTRTLAVTEASQRRVFFEAQFADAKEKLIAAESRLKAANITDGAMKTIPTASIAAVAQLQAQISALEIALRVKRDSQTESSPEVQIIKAQLDAYRNELAKQRQDKTAPADQNQSDYISAFRNFRYFETMYEMMARQYEAARLDEARDGALIQLVDEPQVPEYKSKPKRGLMAVTATLLAFIVCLLWVIVRRSLARMAETPEGAAKLAALRDALRLRRATAPH
ncbi:Wzz/FepE/Etk N-terminal domain-containing protein [Leptothrix sp. BB-4]